MGYEGCSSTKDFQKNSCLYMWLKENCTSKDLHHLNPWAVLNQHAKLSPICVVKVEQLVAQ